MLGRPNTSPSSETPLRESNEGIKLVGGETIVIEPLDEQPRTSNRPKEGAEAYPSVATESICEKLRFLRKKYLPRGTFNYFNLLTMVWCETWFIRTQNTRRKR